jgi:hypothetical protein
MAPRRPRNKGRIPQQKARIAAAAKAMAAFRELADARCCHGCNRQLCKPCRPARMPASWRKNSLLGAANFPVMPPSFPCYPAFISLFYSLLCAPRSRRQGMTTP